MNSLAFRNPKLQAIAFFYTYRTRSLTKAAGYHNFEDVMKLLRAQHSHHHHVKPCPRRCG